MQLAILILLDVLLILILILIYLAYKLRISTQALLTATLQMETSLDELTLLFDDSSSEDDPDLDPDDDPEPDEINNPDGDPDNSGGVVSSHPADHYLSDLKRAVGDSSRRLPNAAIVNGQVHRIEHLPNEHRGLRMRTIIDTEGHTYRQEVV